MMEKILNIQALKLGGARHYTTSIVSVISIQELTFQGTELITGTLLTMEIWITITVLYLALTLPCSLLVQRLEVYMARSRS